MNLFDQCSKTLQLSLLAMLAACAGGADRDESTEASELNPPSTQAAAKDVACAASDAGPAAKADAESDGGNGPATDSGSTALSSRPGDRCGPAGEGDFPWAPCDATRGLVCVAPDRRELDAPATCRCPLRKVFTGGACVSQ
jgi:hypothetical protein